MKKKIKEDNPINLEEFLSIIEEFVNHKTVEQIKNYREP